MRIYANRYYEIAVQTGDNYYTVSGENKGVTRITLPTAEINEKPYFPTVKACEVLKITEQSNNTKEISVFVGETDGVALTLVFTVSDESPIFRYAFTLQGENAKMTKHGGERLCYLTAGQAHELTEVRFSEYDRFLHSFIPTEQKIDPRLYGERRMGPMLIDASPERKLLIAYEHGSQYPDAYLAFTADDALSLSAVKGNYYDGRSLDAPYESVTVQIGIFAPDEDPARAYRGFQLHYATKNASSRKPYLFYNTWCMQERDRWYHGHFYLDTMNEARILEEIDRAHEIGIDVFVMDTGWYEMTGDWRVNMKKFPHGLDPIKKKLDGYGMKLGLWFNPKMAAVKSNVIRGYEDCIQSWKGENSSPSEVWESPESVEMCLVSRYWEHYADRLIELSKTLGVTYFKWDAIGQYGCDSPNHYHGTAENTPEERADCYAFSIGIYMAKIVDRLVSACPDAIVDFDITESGRSTGLGFLSSGKYFLINNGPYYPCYDIPESLSVRNWNNVFVYPGEARTWICRAPLSFDRWIPSVLFLTHYLPDGDAKSALVNVASLILGQNGIWGDLSEMTDEAKDIFRRAIETYKVVKNDITEAYPVTSGKPGGSFEVREKIAENGLGAISFFADGAGTYTYRTAHPISENLSVFGAIETCREPDGTVTVTANGNGILFALPR